MSSSRPKLPAAVVALGVTSLLADVSSEMIAPVMPLFLTATLGAGALQLGLIEGVGDTTASLIRLFSGRWSDRAERRKPWVIAGYAITAATRPLLALAPVWQWVLGCRFLDRVGKGVRSAPRDALIADVVAPEQRGAAYGLHRAMDHTGAMLGPLAAALCLGLGLAPRAIFSLAFLPAVLAVLALYIGVREPARAERITARAIGPVPVTRRFDVIVLLIGLGLRALGTPADMLLLLKLTQEHLSLTHVALVYAAYNGIRALVSWQAGRLADRLAPKTVALVGWISQAALLWVFAVVVTPLAAVAVYWFYAFASGIAEPAEKSYVATLAPPEARGRVFGWYNMTLGLVGVPSGLMIGLLWDLRGVTDALGVASVLIASAAGLVFFTTRTATRRN